MPLDLTHVATDPTISDDEIVIGFATLLTAMRTRGIIRTKNVVGDLGEVYAARAYAGHQNRGPIILEPTNSTDVDARDHQGRTYAIKTVSSLRQTSAFHFVQKSAKGAPAFDFLVVVHVNHLMQPQRVLEFNWSQFFKKKKWSTRQKAWFLPLGKKVVNLAAPIFPAG
jgi:hypothetical protein